MRAMTCRASLVITGTDYAGGRYALPFMKFKYTIFWPITADNEF